MRNVTQRAKAGKPSNVIPFPMQQGQVDSRQLITEGRVDINEWLTGGTDEFVFIHDSDAAGAKIVDSDGRVIWVIRRVG